MRRESVGPGPPEADRASAEAVGTILALATLLIFAGLALPGLNLITQASEVSQANQLEYHAQRLSGEIQTVDQLVRSSDSTGPIGRHVTLPRHIGNEQYTISVVTEPDGDQYLLFESSVQQLSARALFVSETPVANATLTGGDLQVVRRDGDAGITVLPGGES